MKFYPNPTTGNLTVELLNKLKENEKAKISILNNLGQLLIIMNPEIVNGKFKEELKLPPDLSAGSYFLQVEAGEYIYNTRIVFVK